MNYFTRAFEHISPNSKTLKGEAHLLNSHMLGASIALLSYFGANDVHGAASAGIIALWLIHD